MPSPSRDQPGGLCGAPLLESQRVEISSIAQAGACPDLIGSLCDVAHQVGARGDSPRRGLLHDKEFSPLHNRARSLHPRLGRFLQRDPLGYEDGMSLYEYVASAPIGSVDPSGMQRPNDREITPEEEQEIIKSEGLDALLRDREEAVRLHRKKEADKDYAAFVRATGMTPEEAGRRAAERRAAELRERLTKTQASHLPPRVLHGPWDSYANWSLGAGRRATLSPLLLGLLQDQPHWKQHMRDVRNEIDVQIPLRPGVASRVVKIRKQNWVNTELHYLDRYDGLKTKYNPSYAWNLSFTTGTLIRVRTDLKCTVGSGECFPTLLSGKCYFYRWAICDVEHSLWKKYALIDRPEEKWSNGRDALSKIANKALGVVFGGATLSVLAHPGDSTKWAQPFWINNKWKDGLVIGMIWDCPKHRRRRGTEGQRAGASGTP